MHAPVWAACFYLPCSRRETTHIEATHHMPKPKPRCMPRDQQPTKATYKAAAEGGAPRKRRDTLARRMLKAANMAQHQDERFKGKPKHGTTMDSTRQSSHHNIFCVFCPIQLPACKAQRGNASCGLPFFHPSWPAIQCKLQATHPRGLRPRRGVTRAAQLRHFGKAGNVAG